ncbi:MAG: cobalt ECF transporter T component CbiQ [Bacteroidales bacterium]
MKHSFIDKYSGLNSHIHRLDPTVKLVAVFSAIVIIVSEPRGETGSFVFYGGIIFIILVISRIPLKFILSRCLIVSPFILMAALFHPVSAALTNNDHSLQLLLPEFGIALSIIFKAYLSVILLTMLVSTEKFHNLLLGLRQLRMPKLVGILSALMYRYIFILYDEALKTTRARDSRTPGKLKVSRLKTFGNQSALIFLRSWERSQTVHKSMLSRGFKGEFPPMQKMNAGTRDILYSSLFIIIFLAIRLTNHSMGCFLFN